MTEYIELLNGTVGFLKSKSGLNVNHDITSDDVISVMIPKEDVRWMP